MNLSERIVLARKHVNLSQEELAEKLKGLMTQQNISLLERGVTKGTEHIVQLAMACNVRPEWLALGEGDMFNYNRELTAHLEVMEKLPEYARTDVKQYAIKITQLIEQAQAPNQSNGSTKE